MHITIILLSIWYINFWQTHQQIDRIVQNTVQKVGPDWVIYRKEVVPIHPGDVLNWTHGAKVSSQVFILIKDKQQNR